VCFCSSGLGAAMAASGTFFFIATPRTVLNRSEHFDSNRYLHHFHSPGLTSSSCTTMLSPCKRPTSQNSAVKSCWPSKRCGQPGYRQWGATCTQATCLCQSLRFPCLLESQARACSRSEERLLSFYVCQPAISHFLAQILRTSSLASLHLPAYFLTRA
jgi:hypothetical protein